MPQDVVQTRGACLRRRGGSARSKGQERRASDGAGGKGTTRPIRAKACLVGPIRYSPLNGRRGYHGASRCATVGQGDGESRLDNPPRSPVGVCHRLAITGRRWHRLNTRSSAAFYAVCVEKVNSLPLGGPGMLLVSGDFNCSAKCPAGLGQSRRRRNRGAVGPR
jgi:hypothetical protein